MGLRIYKITLLVPTKRGNWYEQQSQRIKIKFSGNFDTFFSILQVEVEVEQVERRLANRCP